MDLEDTENQSQEAILSSADSQNEQTPDLKSEEESNFQTSKTSETNDVEAQNYQKIETDEKLHQEILEKLDIKTKEKALKDEVKINKNEILENNLVKNQIEKSIAKDFAKIQELMQSGLVNSVQGQNLKKQVLKKAFDKLVQTEKIKRFLSASLQQNNEKAKTLNNTVTKENVFNEFGKSNPDFFTQQGRKEVLDYLKSDGVTVGINELNKISTIIRTVEKAAIERYLQKATHEKTLRDSNETAKQRLTANAQKLSYSGNLSSTFTREQIGKMSGSEFAKYEKAIMEALRKGLIK